MMGFCCYFGGWISLCMGTFKIWWQLQSCSRTIEECSADFWIFYSICCHFGRWISCNLGRGRWWWWQHCSSRSSQECAADSSLRSCLCGFISWNCGFLGRLWGRFGHRDLCKLSCNAPECAEDSGHIQFICCDPCWWLGELLGQLLGWEQCKEGSSCAWQGRRFEFIKDLFRCDYASRWRIQRHRLVGRKWQPWIRWCPTDGAGLCSDWDSVEWFCFCCTLGRWISCFLGHLHPWRWQRRHSRSAQEHPIHCFHYDGLLRSH